jgi:hypothetical protein
MHEVRASGFIGTLCWIGTLVLSAFLILTLKQGFAAPLIVNLCLLILVCPLTANWLLSRKVLASGWERFVLILSVAIFLPDFLLSAGFPFGENTGSLDYYRAIIFALFIPMPLFLFRLILFIARTSSDFPNAQIHILEMPERLRKRKWQKSRSWLKG